MNEGKRTIRCAIYTRKSSEEGLEQEFNSLDAQYEACSAYIVSQKSEGWKRTPGQSKCVRGNDAQVWACGAWSVRIFKSDRY